MSTFDTKINVPVRNRPILKFNFPKVFANPILGSSPILPAGLASNPILILARKNVPVVNTTLSA